MSFPSADSRVIAGLVILSVVAVAGIRMISNAQEPPAAPRAEINSYEPDAEHPYGRPNPEAPPELAQMAFMIGEFHCTYTSFQRDGSWKTLETVWGARYFLNGHAILGQNWKPGFTATNLRFFDPDLGKWRVSQFRMPTYGQDLNWIDQQQGEGAGRRVVMSKENTNAAGQTILTTPTFYDITTDTYQWKMERFRDGELLFGGAVWKISCRRLN